MPSHPVHLVTVIASNARIFSTHAGEHRLPFPGQPMPSHPVLRAKSNKKNQISLGLPNSQPPWAAVSLSCIVYLRLNHMMLRRCCDNRLRLRRRLVVIISLFVFIIARRWVPCLFKLQALSSGLDFAITSSKKAGHHQCSVVVQLRIRRSCLGDFRSVVKAHTNEFLSVRVWL